MPGLAVSPILGDLNTIFPSASDLEIQMLTSLPSLLHHPVRAAVGESCPVGRDKLRILVVGLVIFLLSGIACLFIRNITALILVSCILGIGAGMVIPLSTGLVVAYFTGEYRVRQLGYSSSINNLTLVLATALSGYLANIDWHLSFLVYTLPAVSLVLSPFLHRQRSTPEPAASDQMRNKTIDRPKLVRLMALYFFITYAALTITFYAAFLVDGYHLPKAFSGVLISLFFLAIMAPGLILDRIIGIFKGYTNVAAIAMIGAGLFCFGIFRDRGMLVVGALLAGFGYGLMQPSSTTRPPSSLRHARRRWHCRSSWRSTTWPSCSVPSLIDTFTRLTALHGDRVPFLLNGMLTAGTRPVGFPPPRRLHARSGRLLLQTIAKRTDDFQRKALSLRATNPCKESNHGEKPRLHNMRNLLETARRHR